MKYFSIIITLALIVFFGCKPEDTQLKKDVPKEEMERIFQEIKTPYKYGIVLQHPDSTKLVDSPTSFAKTIAGT